MGKAVATAGAVIAGAALIATGIGAAAGIGLLGANAAAVAGSAGSLTLFGASVSALQTIGGLLATVGSLATKRPEIQTGGNPTQQTYDPQAGIPYPMGRTAVGGRIIYGTTTGPTKEPNKYRLHYSILAGAGPIDAIESYSANNVNLTFSADGGEGAAGAYLNRLWQVSRLGAASDTYLRFTATGTKDTPADHSGNPPEWTADHLLGGYAVALTAMEFDAKVYAADVSPLWVLRGVKVYDPRLDDTYPGGDGDCRALDESTYVYSANPWLHALTFALGRYQNGQRIMGFGFPIASLIVSQFVEAANVAEANGWEIGGTIYSTDEKWSVLQAIAQAGGGYCVPMGAQVGCVVNAPRVSLATITSADIRGEASAAGTKGRRERINRVIARFRSEAHGWEIVSAAPIEVATHVTEDGGVWRTREIDYPLVQSVNHAAQLGRYDVENSRELEPISVRVGLPFMGYRPGDCVTIDVPEIGLEGREVLILRRSFDPASATVTFQCRTETDAKHPYALGQTSTAPPTPGLTAPYVPMAPDPSDWTAIGTTFTDNGQSIPALVISGATADPHVGWLMVQYRPSGATDWAAGEGVEILTDADVRSEITSVTRGTTYEVRIAFRSHRGVPGPWTVLTAATVGDFSLEELAAAVDDGVLTPKEKLQLIPWIKGMLARRTGLRARATALGLTSGTNAYRLAYETAATDLDTQLAALTAPVAWDDASGNTTVADPAALRGALEDAQTTGDALQAEIDRVYNDQITDLIDSGGGGTDSTPPGAVSGLAYEASLGTIFLSWDNPADLDLDYVEVWAGSTNNRLAGSTVQIGTAKVQPDGSSSFGHSGLDTGVTRYYWLRAFDKSSNSSTWSSGDTAGFAATTASLTIDDFASTIAPVGRGASLPTPGTYPGDTFFITTTGRLYRKVSGAWEYATPTSDLSGQIVDTQITNFAITTPKLDANAVTTAKLAAAAVDAGIIAAGSVQTSHLSALSVTAAKLAVDSVVAGKVAVGVLTGDRIIVNEIDTQYLKNNSLANAGSVDITYPISVGTSAYTNIGAGGVNIAVVSSSGSYTTIMLVFYVDAVNLDPSNNVGFYCDIVMSGAASGTLTAGSMSIGAYDGNSFCVPITYRTNASGTITFAIGAYAALTTGSSSYVQTSRVKLGVTGIYKS